MKDNRSDRAHESLTKLMRLRRCFCRLELFAVKSFPRLAQFPPQLADATGTDAKPLRGLRRPLAGRERFGDLPVPVGKRLQPRGKVAAEGGLIGHGSSMIFDNGFTPLPFLEIEAIQSFNADPLSFLAVA